MEKDDEVKGTGNSYTTKFRQYDSRVGRWLSLDPLMDKYPSQSPYIAFNNNPIFFSDPTGLEGEPPITVYHNTSVSNAKSIGSGGFKANSGFNYFMTNSSATKAGRAVANAAVQIQLEIDVSKAQKITYKQWNQWYKESLKKLVGESGNITSEIQNRAQAMRNDLARQFMSKSSGNLFVIEATQAKSGNGAQRFIVAKNSIVNKISKITGVTKGGDKLFSSLKREPKPQESAKAKSQFGKAAKFIKWGGRALIVVGIASDAYEIYQSDNKTRTITKKVGAWTGASAGAALGAGIGAFFFGAGAAPGAVIGGFLGGLGGGVGGYFAGEEITETVYDYFFTKGIKPKED